MTRTTTLSLMLAAASLALFGWITYDAGDAAAALGLTASVGEAGVALAGLLVSLALLAMATALPLRQRRVRRRTA
jgi:hypothetical protein